MAANCGMLHTLGYYWKVKAGQQGLCRFLWCLLQPDLDLQLLLAISWPFHVGREGDMFANACPTPKRTGKGRKLFWCLLLCS